MIFIEIDETTEIGGEILRQLIDNPGAGKIMDFSDSLDRDIEMASDMDLDLSFDENNLDDFHPFTEEEWNTLMDEILDNDPDDADSILMIPRDENGNPINYTLKQTRELMHDILTGKAE